MYFDQIEVGKRIRELRMKKKLTQLQMSLKVNISDKHLGALETGKRAPSIDLLVELCSFFQVSLDYLVLGKTETSKADRLRNEIEQIEHRLDIIKTML